ncbi:hypothetical protein PISL3812_07845 [Talaromyces islandicus]|uniref:Thioesterase domain-containing protein n=1 Tax=Talaromyces islandicus TaxID=28573 RepID=A0A0U1M701_TALIS|nr:hypothetical protein PISL3812_07845 [Talaromyces islandicus]
MQGENPVVIQQERLQASSVPLFLIHDGGGTITNYFAFGNLGRDLYGIYNPRFQDGQTWPGGIAEMAKEYAEMVKEMSPSKKILLGGWSLGGFVALQMAHIFANDPIIKVEGLVMIESIFPRTITTANISIDKKDINFPLGTPIKTRQRMIKSIIEATDMVKSYNLPIWSNGGESDSSMDSIHIPTAPPTVLLRAKNPVPSRKSMVVPHMLGWDQYEYDLVKAVYEIPGHHFSIFDTTNIDQFSSSLNEACTLLENGIWG